MGVGVRLLQRWVDFSTAERRVKAVMAKVAMRFLRRSLASAFEGWAESVRTKIRLEGAARRVLARLLQRSVAMAFMVSKDDCGDGCTERAGVFRSQLPVTVCCA